MQGALQHTVSQTDSSLSGSDDDTCRGYSDQIGQRGTIDDSRQANGKPPYLFLLFASVVCMCSTSWDHGTVVLKECINAYWPRKVHKFPEPWKGRCRLIIWPLAGLMLECVHHRPMSVMISLQACCAWWLHVSSKDDGVHGKLGNYRQGVLLNEFSVYGYKHAWSSAVTAVHGKGDS